MKQTAQTTRKAQTGSTNESAKQSRPRPTHRLWQVVGEGKNASWREIGAAWPNRDGEGFSLQWNALPLHGRVVMRRIKAKAA